MAPVVFVIGVSLTLLLTDESVSRALLRGVYLTLFWVALMPVLLLVSRRGQ